MESAQIQLTESQARILKKMAAEKETTVAELICQSVDELIRHSIEDDDDKRNDAEREEQRRRALSIVGAFSSGVDDLSINHDKYLAIAYANVAGDE